MGLPTIAELHEALFHDDASGCLHWKKPQSNRARRGDVAGWVSGNGYRIVGIGGRQLYAHRVVFALCHGRWPSAVDHINGNPLDNRIENLREAGGTQNNANRSAQVNNMAGFKGVFWYKRDESWRAKIQVNRKNIHIGYFDDPDVAGLAYDRAAALLFGPFARLNFNPDENAGRPFLIAPSRN